MSRFKDIDKIIDEIGAADYMNLLKVFMKIDNA